MRPSLHLNQFDKIRILAALGVIVSHHFSLTGTQGPAWFESRWLNWAFLGGVCVMVFLCISGYLVMHSWLRAPRFPEYLWKRFLRLWPGLFASVLACVFLFGVTFTSLPTGEFLSSPGTWRFVLANSSLFTHNPMLPGVFLKLPQPELMNGVYWTLPLEFMCYLVLGILGVAGLLRFPTLFNVLVAAYVAGFLIFANYDFTGRIYHWIEYPAFFAAGAWIALHDKWFSQHGKRLMQWLVPILLLIYFFTPLTSTARFFILPIVVIYVGKLPATENWFVRLGDPSYGIYLYGCPVAQSVIALAPQLNFWMSMALALAGSTLVGYLSWHLVEKRALRLKAAFPLRFGKLTR